MTDVYSHQSRLAHFNFVVDEFHRKVAKIISEIDTDHIRRGLYKFSSHLRLKEVFDALGIVPDEMLSFDMRHAKYTSDLLAVGGKWDGINPFCESHESQVIGWLASEAKRIPLTLRERSITLLFPQGPGWLPAAESVAKRISYKFKRSYGELRASFELMPMIALELAEGTDTGLNKGVDGLSTTSAHVGKKQATRSKRSTVKNEACLKLISALTKHHEYANGGCLNLKPIGNNELSRLADVDKATASAFFKRQFKGHDKYKVICKDASKLVAALKMLNGEFAPHLLYGSNSTNECERDEE